MPRERRIQGSRQVGGNEGHDPGLQPTTVVVVAPTSAAHGGTRPPDKHTGARRNAQRRRTPSNPSTRIPGRTSRHPELVEFSALTLSGFERTKADARHARGAPRTSPSPRTCFGQVTSRAHPTRWMNRQSERDARIVCSEAPNAVKTANPPL